MIFNRCYCYLYLCIQIIIIYFICRVAKLNHKQILFLLTKVYFNLIKIMVFHGLLSNLKKTMLPFWALCQNGNNIQMICETTDILKI